MHKTENRNRKIHGLLLSVGITFLGAFELLSAQAFTLTDSGNHQLDIHIGDKPVGRYMFGHDPSTPESLHQTYKPFLHIIDPETKKPITKGPGGQFTHHRGIYLGWNRLTTDEGRFDLWHMNKGLQIHRSFEEKNITPQSASFTSNVHWIVAGEKVVIDEMRTMTFTHDGLPETIAIVDLTTELSPMVNLELNGDPEHAGVQYRPANEVDKKATKYLFPKEGQDPRKDFNLPWVNEYYELNGKGYSVTHMNHPDNPKPSRYSAYRNYGRFGAFFTKSLDKGEKLTLKYRFAIRKGKPEDRSEIQEDYTKWISKN